MTTLKPLTDKLESYMDESQLEIRILEEMRSTTGGVPPSSLVHRPGNLILRNDGGIDFLDKRGETIPCPSESGVFILVGNVLDAAAPRYKVSWLDPHTDKVRYVRSFVKEQNEVPCVVFSVKYRKPGQFSKGSMGNATTRILKPTIVTTIDDPEYSNSQIHIMSQFYDSEINLTVVALTNEEADKMLSWVEEMIAQNLWYFKHSGINEFHFKERNEDSHELIGEQTVYKRTLTYFVQYEKLSWYSSATLRKLILKLQVV
jgi:hypothetical protein